ncbi:MAG: patatin-like phospholipase family protein [Microthrixaceae bacterium]|nr:patatin-like phospholipase family protein [Microthrixaceae bacterium]
MQVGMLQALTARGIIPDLVIGTSAGALNATYIAGHGVGVESLDQLAAIWTGLRRSDVFPVRPLRLAAAALGRVPSLCDDGVLRRLIARHLPFDRLESASIPVRVIATDVRSGDEVVLAAGNVVDAVMASAAIPAVFPTVRIAGRDLADGGVADNAAISQAVACGADRIYVLPTGYACALDDAPATVLSSALHALTLLIEQRLILEVAHYADRADIRVLPPLCPLSTGAADFHHGAELIDRARRATSGWLETPRARTAHPEAVLSLHDHHPGSRKPSPEPVPDATKASTPRRRFPCESSRYAQRSR